MLTRFAPSPTGLLHPGHAFAALRAGKPIHTCHAEHIISRQHGGGRETGRAGGGGY